MKINFGHLYEVKYKSGSTFGIPLKSKNILYGGKIANGKVWAAWRESIEYAIRNKDNTVLTYIPTLRTFIDHGPYEDYGKTTIIGIMGEPPCNCKMSAFGIEHINCAWIKWKNNDKASIH